MKDTWLQVRISADMEKQIDKLAKKRRMKKSAWIRFLIENEIIKDAKQTVKEEIEDKL